MTEQSNEIIDTSCVVAPVMTIKDAKKKLNEIQLYISKSFTPDIDLINPGSKKYSWIKEKTLLKPGADKIREFLGLGFDNNLVDKHEKYNFSGNYKNAEGYDPPIFSYTYRCRVYSLRHPDVTICTVDGNCNTLEKKYMYVKIYENGNYAGQRMASPTEIYSVINTVIKMAQKRAYVGAIVSAARLSYMFTPEADWQDDTGTTEIIEKINNPAITMLVGAICCEAGKLMTNAELSKLSSETIGEPSVEKCIDEEKLKTLYEKILGMIPQPETK